MRFDSIQAFTGEKGDHRSRFTSIDLARVGDAARGPARHLVSTAMSEQEHDQQPEKVERSASSLIFQSGHMVAEVGLGVGSLGIAAAKVKEAFGGKSAESSTAKKDSS